MLRLPGSMPPVTVESEEAVQEASRSACGVLVLFAHYGNWELLMPVLAKRLGGLTVIAKPMKNPLVDRWLVSQRAQCHFEVAPPGNAVRTALRVLQSGGAVAVAIDQWPGDMGTPCMFLGKKTKTVRTVAGLVNLTRCTTLAAYAIMEPSGSYRVIVRGLPPPSGSPDEDCDAVATLQLHHNEIVSAWIMERPEHWFGWFHRRFKDLLEY
jgi:KDO2-lipid IV(A) lauroyltransferase